MRKISKQIKTEKSDFIFVTPERFTNQEFLAELRKQNDQLCRDRRSTLHFRMGSRFPSCLSIAWRRG